MAVLNLFAFVERLRLLPTVLSLHLARNFSLSSPAKACDRNKHECREQQWSPMPTLLNIVFDYPEKRMARIAACWM